MIINKKLIKYNFTPNANSPVYIIVHDTGNRSIGANAEMHYQYFNGGNRNASAHLFVDDKQILQLIEFKDKSWNCGDGGNMYGINNGNTISIEMCINADGNYDIMVDNTIELVAYLMKQFNLGIDKVVRHYDASRKNCPQTMNNAGDWSKWLFFKQQVQDKFNQLYPSIDQWEYDAVQFLSSSGFTTPREIMTMATFAAMINNYTTKLNYIDTIPYLCQQGFLQLNPDGTPKYLHTPSGQITFGMFANMYMNRLKDYTNTNQIPFLLNKGFITSTKNIGDFVTVAVFGAMMKNYLLNNGKI